MGWLLRTSCWGLAVEDPRVPQWANPALVTDIWPLRSSLKYSQNLGWCWRSRPRCRDSGPTCCRQRQRRVRRRMVDRCGARTESGTAAAEWTSSWRSGTSSPRHPRTGLASSRR